MLRPPFAPILVARIHTELDDELSDLHEDPGAAKALGLLMNECLHMVKPCPAFSCLEPDPHWFPLNRPAVGHRQPTAAQRKLQGNENDDQSTRPAPGVRAAMEAVAI